MLYLRQVREKTLYKKLFKQTFVTSLWIYLQQKLILNIKKCSTISRNCIVFRQCSPPPFSRYTWDRPSEYIFLLSKAGLLLKKLSIIPAKNFNYNRVLFCQLCNYIYIYNISLVLLHSKSYQFMSNIFTA